MAQVKKASLLSEKERWSEKERGASWSKVRKGGPEVNERRKKINKGLTERQG